LQKNQISVNSVDACFSYNVFSEVTPIQNAHVITTAQTRLSMSTCENINSRLPPKCPPCAQIHARGCGQNCLIASSMNTWWKCYHSLIKT